MYRTLFIIHPYVWTCYDRSTISSARFRVLDRPLEIVIHPIPTLVIYFIICISYCNINKQLLSRYYTSIACNSSVFLPGIWSSVSVIGTSLVIDPPFVSVSCSLSWYGFPGRGRPYDRRAEQNPFLTGRSNEVMSDKPISCCVFSISNFNLFKSIFSNLTYRIILRFDISVGDSVARHEGRPSLKPSYDVIKYSKNVSDI